MTEAALPVAQTTSPLQWRAFSFAAVFPLGSRPTPQRSRSTEGASPSLLHAVLLLGPSRPPRAGFSTSSDLRRFSPHDCRKAQNHGFRA
jgi:hypothetical protein